MRLSDPNAPVSLPPLGSLHRQAPLDNRELDKLVGTLGRNKATWRRALVLYEWLQESGHQLDDRLCTTVSVIRQEVCIPWGHFLLPAPVISVNSAYASPLQLHELSRLMP